MTRAAPQAGVLPGCTATQRATRCRRGRSTKLLSRDQFPLMSFSFSAVKVSTSLIAASVMIWT